MHLAAIKWVISVPFLVISSLAVHPCAEGRGNCVIEHVSTLSEENLSVVLVKLSGHPTYKSYPIGDKEILIAFKDTELSGGVYVNETIVGDELVKAVELAQRPSRVTSLLVKTYKPCGELGYQIRESNDGLHIEIKDKSKVSETDPKKAMSEPSTSRPISNKGLTTSKSESGMGNLLAVEPGPHTPGRDLFLEAIDYCRMSKWDQAIPILKRIVGSYPNSPLLERAYFLLARSIHRKFEKELSGHLVEITSHYQAAINKFPGSEYLPGAMVSTGNCYFQANQYYEALAHYDLVLKKGKDPGAAAEAMLQRGRVLALTRRPLDALRQFEELERHYPETPFATRSKVEIAKILFNMKSFKRSLKALNEITRAQPDEIYKDSDILLYAGYNNYELGRLQEARDIFSKVFNYFPELESIDLLLTRIGDTYREEGTGGKASKLYELVAKTYPDAEGGLISSLRLAEEAEQDGTEDRTSDDKDRIFTKTAQDIYEQIIEKSPEHPISQLAMLKLANLQKGKKHFKESIKMLRDILDKHPEAKLRLEVGKAIQDATLKLAQQQQENGKHEQCIMSLEEILVEYPTARHKEEIKSTLRVCLKAFLEQKKQEEKFEEIVSCYQRMKSALPLEDMPDILLLLGDAHKRVHLYGHALSIFGKARRLFADQYQPANLLLGLGESAYKEKEFNKAEGPLKAFTARFPAHDESSKAHYWLGRIHLQRKDYKKALQSLETALRKKPDQHRRVKVLTAIAKVSRVQGAYEKAARRLEEAIALLQDNKSGSSKDLFIAYRQLGENYLRLGQKGKAVPSLEKALELNPKGWDTNSLQFRLAQCYQRMEAPGKAEKMFNQIVVSGDPFWSKLARTEINEMNIKQSAEKSGYGLTATPAL